MTEHSPRIVLIFFHLFSVSRTFILDCDVHIWSPEASGICGVTVHKNSYEISHLPTNTSGHEACWDIIILDPHGYVIEGYGRWSFPLIEGGEEGGGGYQTPGARPLGHATCLWDGRHER